jgi:hypothetical protein
MIDNLSDDDLLIIYKSILNFLNEDYKWTETNTLPTPMQKIMDNVLLKYNLEMGSLTEYLCNKYDNSGITFYDKNESALNYFRLRSKKLYSGLLGMIREKRIDEILYLKL